MALVAYDYESSSESEDGEETEDSGSSVVILNKSVPSQTVNTPVERSVVNDLKSEDGTFELSSRIFSTLPKTKVSVSAVKEDQIEDFIPRSKPIKEKQKVKISIPSLSQFDDDGDDEPTSKKLKQSTKGSGLMALLPPVRGSVLSNKSFVPNVVANKNKITSNPARTSAKGLIPNALKKISEAKKAELMKKLSETSIAPNNSDIESDDDLEMSETYDEEMWKSMWPAKTKTNGIRARRTSRGSY